MFSFDADSADDSPIKEEESAYVAPYSNSGQLSLKQRFPQMAGKPTRRVGESYMMRVRTMLTPLHVLKAVPAEATVDVDESFVSQFDSEGVRREITPDSARLGEKFRLKREFNEMAYICASLESQQASAVYASGTLKSVPLSILRLQLKSAVKEEKRRNLGLPYVDVKKLLIRQKLYPRNLVDLFREFRISLDEESTLRTSYLIYEKVPSLPLYLPISCDEHNNVPNVFEEHSEMQQHRCRVGPVAQFRPELKLEKILALRSAGKPPSEGRAAWIIDETKKLIRSTKREVEIQFLNTLLWLYKPSYVSLGARNIASLLWYFGNPTSSLKIIVVTGTCGKSSVAAKIASGLSRCRYRVGLLTSPHLLSIRERIAVNGVPISRSDFNMLLAMVRRAAVCLGICPNMTDIITVASILYFVRLRCTYVVMECNKIAAGTSLTLATVCTVLTGGPVYADAIARSLVVQGPKVPTLPNEIQAKVERLGPAQNETIAEENTRVAE